jgi:hypothetical protein
VIKNHTSAFRQLNLAKSPFKFSWRTKMKLRNKILTNLLATALVVISTTASAFPSGWYDLLPAWTATASSCTLDESSAGKSEFSGTQFRYLGSAISNVTFKGFIPIFIPITVRCNVTPFYEYQSTGSAQSVFWDSLIVGYKDPDGISGKAQVSVSLRKVNRATQGETTIATFNSNTSDNLTNSVVAHEDEVHFKSNESPDFKNNAYYVEINLIRTDVTVTTPIVYTVRLANGGILG